MRSDLIKNKRNILIAAVTISLFGCMQSANAENIHSYSNLQKAIQSATTSVINLENNIAATSQTGELGALGSALLNLYGNGYDINGNGQTGIIIGSGQTLNINNVGTDGSKGFSGFVTQDVGGAIYSEGGNINVSNSIFSDNQSLLNYSGGGAIYAQDTNLNINDSTFIGNSTINKDIASGGALLINQYSPTNVGSTTISNSDFIDNFAMRGGAIYNSTAEVTIKDTTFTGNTAGEDGGAIYNQGGTLNIIAENSDTVFTGNSANGESNAIYNNGSTTNLNAKGGKIIFNDGINGNGTININNNSDASGIVEFNNTVSNNNINLYNGTLKLGHYAGGTITGADGQTIDVAESWGNFDNSVNLNLNGGTLDVIDNEIRNYTVGSLNGNGSEFALDLDFNTNTADTFTVNGGNATIHFSDINIIGDLPTENRTIQIINGANDNITLTNYALFTTDANITFTSDSATKGSLIYAYNEGQGGLKAAVDYSAGDRKYQMTESETITQNLGEMQTPNSILTIEGNGYDIIAEKTDSGENQYYGITVNNGQTLNINNVGTDGSKGFSGFVTQDVGGAIYSEGGNINVSNSIFSDNQSLLNYSGGGAIYAQDTNLNIKDSTFNGNSTINKDIASGGALLINQYSPTNVGSTTINNSDFIDNFAIRGGAIYNSTAEVTIKDTTFTGNTATEDGGAIYNQGGTLNIVAEDSDTVFTGNSANGESNAIFNNGSTTNLNAKGGKIIFNDGISGSGTININNDSDADGIVEFNSSVKNNNIYLYDGTLKLGSHTYTQEENSFLAGQTVYGSLEGSNFTVKAGGTPTVDLIDNVVRETNLGNISLETDLQLAIDADLQANTADKITGSVGTANNNNIIISDVNILNGLDHDGFVETVITDSNLKDLVILAADAEINKPAADSKNYVLTYDGSGVEGILTFDNRNNLAVAVKNIAEQKTYTMNSNELVTENLGSMGGNVLNINGNGYDVIAEKTDTGENQYNGITVNNGQTLNINNVGTEGSKGFSGFITQDVGGAIYSEGGTINISNSIFSDNQSLLNYSGGGAIYAQDTNLNIKDSTFIGNSTINKDIASGGALLINQYSTTNIGSTTISNSDFIGNSAMRGGAIYNSTAEVTIKDTTFTGNTAGEDGGAIYNINSTLNITAENSDSVFTGNTANGVSNAIYNNGSTTNLNAKGGKIIFNDGISGGGTINVNNDSDADGVVEFNNTVSYNDINLYDGTLRLGHYAGGTITGADGQTIEVAESRGNFGNSVNLNLNGGTLDVIDNEIRNYTLGTFNGNGGKLSFDLNIDTNTADTFTISGGQGTFSFDNINLIGDFTPVINRIQLFKGDAANISFDTYAIFTNHNIIEFSDAGNGWLDYATAYAHGLKAAVDYFAGDRKYQMTESETITQNLGEMKTPNSTLTVEGSGYDIIAEKTETGENQYYGITVNNGQTLNINNVGTDGSKGFSGFVSSGDGGAIHSEGGTINVSNSVFSDNLSTIDLGGGGAIFANNSQMNIKDSAFIGNRTIDTGTITGGGALYINQNNTEINGSDFINNSAMRGGAIYNSQAEITLTDSIFTGNTATEGGGAIYNINSTLNITAENSDSIFTGNSTNGDSNAIHNVSSTVNLNAKGRKIVFNDGISGSTSNSININNDSDAGGVVEFNSSVKNNNIYLYDGTLKLGSHTYTQEENVLLAGQTVYGSLEGSNFTVKAGRTPTVDLIDNAVRETNLGNISLETDLQLAIDADLQANTADKITGSVGTANNNNIIISDVNILTDTNQPSTTVIVADENLKDLVILSDYAEITKPADVKNNYMLAYDNTDGSLTFNQELTLASVIAQTASDRIYNMAMDEEAKYDLGIMGGDGSRLTVNAGGYDINGNGYSGVTVNQGQTLNINNTGSESSKGFNGFVSKKSGGAVNNNGTLNITDSSFSYNKAAIGGAIYNNGTANINADNKNVIFANNSASQNGGAIYNELNATLNMDAKNNNKIVFNFGNDIYNAGTIRLNSGTVELNSGISGTGSTEINGGTFVLGNNVSIEQNSFTINNGSEFSIGSTNKLTVNELLSNNGKLTNDGSIVIGGTSSVISGNEITGSGTTFITGTVENQSTISQAVDIETGAALTSNTSGLGGTINNDGSLILAGTLDKEISGTGITFIDESLAFTNNADIKGLLDLNEGNLNLQDNGLNEYKAGNLKGNGTVSLEADMSNSSSDKFIITDGSENNANVTISSVNITKDYDLQGTAEKTTLTVLGGNIENVTHEADGGDGSLVTLTNDYRYEFTAIENGQLNVDIDKSTYRLSDYIDGTAKADNYSLTRDENVFSKTEIGTTSGDDKEKTVYLNGHNLIGDTEHSGITVTDGYTLNLNNGTLKDFDTALNNEGTLNLSGVTFENNKTDVANNNILNLSGSNSITGGITGKNGITNITDGKTTISSEIENIVNISDGAALEGSADYLGNTIANDGSLKLTAGVISNEISGNGTTHIIGEVTNNSTISQAVDIETDAKLISNASGLGAVVTNDGTLELNGGSLENNVSGTGTTNITDKVTNNAVISQNLAISENGDLTNNNDITANITNKGNLTSFADNIKGSVENSGNYNVTGGVISNAITGNGNTNIQASTTLANTITDGTINLNSGLLTFTQNASVADAGAFVVNGGALSLQDGVIQNTNLGNVTLNQDLDLRLDGNFAQHKLDTISANSFNSNGNSINISNILITEPTKDMTFSISPLGSGMSDDVRSALAGAIQYTGGDIVYSPIYKYSASYDPTMGMFNFAKSSGGGYSSFNPDVFAAPVAAQLGGYLVQLNSYDNAFRNMDMYMLMTKDQRQAMKMRNRYAATNKNIVFDPTITRYENKAGWFRPYATFESVPLNNGPDVSNVAYGSFFGAESELYDLGHGWDGMWGVYAGYNGSHQAYDGVSIYQNGGTFGAVGMAYKGNFFTGLTANVGASVGEASAMFGNEDFAMLMSGVASKTGYNFELAKGKFIIQPSLLMSYSFINTFDYHNAAGVSINSDPLHAIQLEPGIKFIGNLKNGWQPYLGVSVVWNIMDKTHFQANNVSLPNLSIDPFVKYGVGVRKSWGERFTGFFQTYITNGGRNGVGLQAGFRWTLGKAEPDKQKTAGKLPELPKTRMLLTGNK